MVRDVPYTGSRQVDVVGAVLSVVGMGGVVLGILVWQEGGEFVGLLMLIGAVALVLLARWLIRRKREKKVTLLDPDLFRQPNFTAGISGQMLQQVTLGGAMIALPLFFQMTLEYNALEAGLSLAPLSLTMFAAAVVAGKKAGDRRPAAIIRTGFVLTTLGIAIIIPFVPRADSGWYFVIPLAITGCGLGLLVSQLNNYTLAPIEEERVSEAAGVNSAAGSFGLSFGLAMAGGLMLAALSVSFTQMTENSEIIPAAQQQQIAAALEDDAEVMSNTQLEQQITGEPASGGGRGRGHQQRRPQPLAADRPAGAAPRRPARIRQLLPDAAPARPQAVVLTRRHGLRLTRCLRTPIRSAGELTVKVCAHALGPGEVVRSAAALPYRPPRRSTRRRHGSPSSASAAATRWVVSELWGVVPGSSWNCRANVRGDMSAGRASRSTLSAPARFSRIQASSGPRVSASQSRTWRAMNWAWPPSRCGGTRSGAPWSRDPRAVLLPHQLQRRVDAGRRPGAGHDVAVVDVEHLGTHLRLGIGIGELLGVAPVGRALAAIEQPGGAEDERCRAVGESIAPRS